MSEYTPAEIAQSKARLIRKPLIEDRDCLHGDWIVTERGTTLYVTLCLDCGERAYSHNINDWSIDER